MLRSLLSCLVMLAAAPALAENLVVRQPGYTLELRGANGSIERLTEISKGTVFRSGELGLWQARFSDGSALSAADFSIDNPAKRYQAKRGADDNWELSYQSDELQVVVRLTAGADGARMTAQVRPGQKTLLDFALPARVRFNPAETAEVIVPSNGNHGVGMALSAGYFDRQSADKPSAWASQKPDKVGYNRLFPKGALFGPVDPPAVKLSVTDEGRQWLTAQEVKSIDGRKAVVNRATRREDSELILVESADGPYFTASRLKGSGALWRVGGKVSLDEEPIVLTMVGRAVERLARQPAGRTKIGLLNLTRGPAAGAWASTSVGRWQTRLGEAAHRTRLELVEIVSVEQMLAALAGREYISILNPYGEQIPTSAAAPLMAMVDAVAAYVRAGGNWFETGGYSFCQELRPVTYYRAELSYPPAFADFLHFRGTAGRVAIYRVAPRGWEPWSGAKDAKAIFTPGKLSWGGDEQGGYAEHVFSNFVKPGHTWTAPEVRLHVGIDAPAAAKLYAQLNGVTRPLAQKAPANVLSRLSRSVLVYFAGSCAEKLEYLDRLPKPTLIHYADYLKGGFDKEYPDHLPPHPNFGTPEQFKQFFAEARRAGHLMMPYTNPTWWCDDPPGPTFAKHGKPALSRTLEGKYIREKYNKNEGYTICFWHPDVQDANRRTRRQFTADYPVDVLFQDQCGARGWRYDTNAAAPNPAAYIEGLLSMVDEDSRVVPLSTEAGWDQVVNSQTQLCGLSFELVPSKHGPAWRRLMRDQVSPDLWRVFPLSQYIAHDKSYMLHHDLGMFVTDSRSLAWTLGLGFSLSYRLRAKDLSYDAPRNWLLWLDRLQKSVVARYVGRPLDSFDHQRKPGTPDNDGVMTARYGDLRLAANLDPQSAEALGHRLAGFGFWAEAPGLTAGSLAEGGEGNMATAFVLQASGDERGLWLFGPGGATAALVAPAGVDLAAIQFDNQPAETKTTTADGMTRVRLPSASDATPRLWHAKLPAN